MRKLLLVLLIAASVPPRASSAQNPPADDPASSRPAASDVEAPILRITTREVLVDLIALDRHNQPVLDLKPNELQVSAAADQTEPKKKRKAHGQDPLPPAAVEPITHLSIFDPNHPSSPSSDSPTGFRILASCLERTTAHYLLSFHPGSDGLTSGFHRIAITTTRPAIKLFYRHHYYVGLTAPASGKPPVKPNRIDPILQQSACYYPVDPLSIALHARLIDTGRTDVLRYLVSVDAGSLSFLTLENNQGSRGPAGFDRRVQLDYGTCNFDTNGKPLTYFHAPLDNVLSSADYARALDRGFPHILEFPASGHIALTRIVLRDRATGNMGAADITVPQIEPIMPVQTESAAAHTEGDLKTYEDLLDFGPDRDGHRQPRAWIRPSPGPIGTFGSIVPASPAFCGDVYELPGTSDHLPEFRDLDPIGSLYTPSLDVPNQFFSNTSGIPGVTPRTNLFGIDYHASFWVQIPGEYRFRLASDDGAILQIDDNQIINLDGLHSVDSASARIHLDAGLHTIHLPYYQGAVDSVALELWIKPPDATKWTLFNLNNYQPPASTAAVRN